MWHPVLALSVLGFPLPSHCFGPGGKSVLKVADDFVQDLFALDKSKQYDQVAGMYAPTDVSLVQVLKKCHHNHTQANGTGNHSPNGTSNHSQSCHQTFNMIPPSDIINYLSTAGPFPGNATVHLAAATAGGKQVQTITAGQQDVVIHAVVTLVIPNNPPTLDFVGNMYVCIAGSPEAGFKVHTSILYIGGTASGTNHTTADPPISMVIDSKRDDPKVEIAALDNAFNAAYNSQKFDEVAALYAEGAFLVPQGAHPPTIDSILPRDEIEGFFKEAYTSGLHPVKLTPLQVIPEGDSILHEFGSVSPLPDPYYVRWVKAAGTWKIALDLMAIGM